MLQPAKNKTRRHLKTLAEQNALEEFIHRVYLLRHEEARQLIWQLTYAPETVLNEKTQFEQLSSRQIKALRTETIRQYQLVDSSLDYNVYCQKAKKNEAHYGFLRRCAKGDGVIIREILYRIETRDFNDREARMISLNLRSDRRDDQTSGFYGLGFNLQETNFLLTFDGLARAASYVLELMHHDKECFGNA